MKLLIMTFLLVASQFLFSQNTYVFTEDIMDLQKELLNLKSEYSRLRYDVNIPISNELECLLKGIDDEYSILLSETTGILNLYYSRQYIDDKHLLKFNQYLKKMTGLYVEGLSIEKEYLTDMIPAINNDNFKKQLKKLMDWVVEMNKLFN